MLWSVTLEGPMCTLCGKVSVSTCVVRGPVFRAVSVAGACCPTLAKKLSGYEGLGIPVLDSSRVGCSARHGSGGIRESSVFGEHSPGSPIRTGSSLLRIPKPVRRHRTFIQCWRLLLSLL